MRVFKFGGACVRNIDLVQNLISIVSSTDDQLVLVISAMGKTTNRLERVVRAIDGDDRMYDQIVSNGEMWSTRIVAAMMRQAGIDVQWLDATRIIRTDSTFRAANVDFAATNTLLRKAMQGHRVTIIQGFIGGNGEGLRTTLGREGSDYTAAIVANLLDAESVTLWKDVAGVYDSDPKTNPDAKLLDHLTYADAERMSLAGAQIIHPKTMKPLADKNIPLFVKSFLNPALPGTKIG